MSRNSGPRVKLVLRPKISHARVLQVENRIPPDVIEALRRLGHRVEVRGSFMMDSGTTIAGVDSEHGTLFGAGDVRRQRFVTGF